MMIDDDNGDNDHKGDKVGEDSQQVDYVQWFIHKPGDQFLFVLKAQN